MKITIAGASGFIGKHLIESIHSKYKICGLSRRSHHTSSNIEWVSADLFSYQSVSTALKNTDIAIYLVHSMLPSSKLFQGNFQDTDLFLADNFARACMQNGVKQIIYLGGLAPQGKISEHLKSRIEVESVFRATGIPVTILRAGMVVGDKGSSFEILKNLVLNLPLMVLPKWTNTTTQAIYIDDLIRVIDFSINNEQVFNQTINVVNGERTSYKKLIKEASEYFSNGKLLINVPINYTSFSKLWVKLFGQADYELVSPLIDSLLCDLSYDHTPEVISNLIEYKSFKQMLTKLSKERMVKKAVRVFDCNTVRSIQRLENKQHLDVEQISKFYVSWLPVHMRNIIEVRNSRGKLCFYLKGLKLPLLILSEQESLGQLDRIKFHIVGGLLTKTKDTGWLEFRSVLGGEYTLVSINEFVPSLPWFIYKYTQAVVHLIVMKSFGRHISLQQNV